MASTVFAKASAASAAAASSTVGAAEKTAMTVQRNVSNRSIARDQFRWCDAAGWRDVLDDNVALGICPCFRTRRQPSLWERLSLLALFLSTGLFVQHLSLLAGEVCRESYDKQCGPFELSDHAGGYSVNLTQSLPSLGAIQDSISGRELPSGILGRLDVWRSRLLAWFRRDGRRFDCEQPMCDILAPRDVPLAVAKDFMKKQDMRVPPGPVIDVLGYCRCQSADLWRLDWFDLLERLVSCLLFQTLLPMIFRALLITDFDEKRGWRGCCSVLTNIVLNTVIILQMCVVFLVRFDVEAWTFTIVTSLIYMCTVGILVSYVFVKCSERFCCPRRDEPGETPYAALAPSLEHPGARGHSPKSGCGESASCLEPPAPPLEPSYVPVGSKRGAYQKVTKFVAVGPGLGEYQKEGGRCNAWPYVCCLGCLAITALVAVGLYFLLSALLALEPRESQPRSANPEGQKGQQGQTYRAPDANTTVGKLTTTAPPLKHDCQSGASNLTAWSLAKKDYCCRAEALGCPEDNGYNCQVGMETWEEDWSPGQKHFCCGYDLSGCPKIKTTTEAAPSSSTTEAPPSSSTSTSPPSSTSNSNEAAEDAHDCQRDALTWLTSWSAEKKRWCCDKRQQGCAEPENACDTMCTAQVKAANGTLVETGGSCRQRIAYVATHQLAGKPDACDFALGAVLRECLICGVCAVADSGCEEVVNGGGKTTKRRLAAAETEQHLIA